MGTVDHDGAETIINTDFGCLGVVSVVQIQCHRNRGLFHHRLHQAAKSGDSTAHLLGSCVHEIRPPAHESCGRLNQLYDGRSAQLLVDTDDRRRLVGGVYVKCTYCVTVPERGFENVNHWNLSHFSHLVCFF